MRYALAATGLVSLTAVGLLAYVAALGESGMRRQRRERREMTAFWRAREAARDAAARAREAGL
jgi:type II secretory pathway pseudopilin PulG